MSLLAWSYRDGPKKPLHAWKDLQRKRIALPYLRSIIEAEPSANLGVITGKLSGLIVVDADDDDAIDWCMAHLPPSPWTVITGRGLQLGYAAPAQPVRNGTNVLRHSDAKGQLDIRGEGGYVAVPPSLHKTGNTYAWSEPMNIIDRICALPPYDPSWFPTAPAPTITTTPPPPIIDDSLQLRRARAWLAKRDPAVSGSSGDTHTYITACNLIHDFALDDTTAWALLCEWNTTCQPPWTHKDLRKKFDSAKATGSASRGSKAHKPFNHEKVAEDVANWAVQLGQRDASEPEPEFPHTDTGNSERMLWLYGNQLRYCWPWEKWLVWDGARWRKDDRGHAMHFAKQAAISNPDPKWSNKSLAHARLTAAVSLSRSSIDHTVVPDMFDRDPWQLNVYNGTVDLRTGKLSDHNPGDLNTKLAPVTYDPDAQCPRWLLFLDQVFAGDPDMLRYIQQAVGYSLTARQTDHLFFFCYGTGSNGKTTFLKTLLMMLGDYGKQTPHDLLMESHYKSHPTDLAYLHGLRFAVGTEVKEGSGFDEGRLNMLTGSDIVTARFMRGDFFDFEPTHHLWLAGNHRPRVKTTAHGLWRRMRLIPFSVCFSKENMDRELPNKLLSELPGILSWAVQGTLDWQKHGFKTPEAISTATKQYRADENVFGTYLDERYTRDPQAKTLCKTFREDYVIWCEDQGFKPLGARAMGNRLRVLGYSITKSAGNRHWKGLQFNP